MNSKDIDVLDVLDGSQSREDSADYRLVLRREQLVLRRSVTTPSRWWLARLDGSGIVATAAYMQRLQNLIGRVLRDRAETGEWSNESWRICRASRNAYSVIAGALVQIPAITRQELLQWQGILSYVDEG